MYRIDKALGWLQKKPSDGPNMPAIHSTASCSYLGFPLAWVVKCPAPHLRATTTAEGCLIALSV